MIKRSYNLYSKIIQSKDINDNITNHPLFNSLFTSLIYKIMFLNNANNYFFLYILL